MSDTWLPRELTPCSGCTECNGPDRLPSEASTCPGCGTLCNRLQREGKVTVLFNASQCIHPVHSLHHRFLPTLDKHGRRVIAQEAPAFNERPEGGAKVHEGDKGDPAAEEIKQLMCVLHGGSCLQSSTALILWRIRKKKRTTRGTPLRNGRTESLTALYTKTRIARD